MVESPSQAALKAPLIRCLTVQVRVIGALLLREVITRYGRHGLGFMWIFLEPMMFTLGVTALWTIMKSVHGGALPITEFAVTGYSTVLMWRNAASRTVLAIEPNLSLLYHRNVRVFDIFAARVILEISGATISLIVIGVAFIAIGWNRIPVDILTLTYAWLLLSWFTFGLGFVIGALSERWESFERIWHTATYLFFPLSGAVFLVEWLPEWAKKYVVWFPTVHCTEMLRHGYWGNTVRTHYDVSYLMTFNLILLLFGLALAWETGRLVEPE